MSDITFSIVLPLYRQESHINELVAQYVAGLSSMPETWELILVVNGDQDNGFAIAQQHAKADLRIIAMELKEGGWGRAVRQGMHAARGEFCCYTNSARTQIKDLLLILKYARVNRDVVVKATRIVRGSLIRKMGSILYNFENRLLFKTAVMDVNGTPKVFARDVWQQLRIESNGDLIDAEAIAKCFRSQIPVIEVPVRITDRREGKSTTRLSSAINMYIGLIKLYSALKT